MVNFDNIHPEIKTCDLVDLPATCKDNCQTDTDPPGIL